MKIITEDRVYVQYQDAFNLPTIVSLLGITCPVSVTRKCYQKDFVVTGDNRYAFIEFTEKESIDFFKKIDCIANYNELINKSEEELFKEIDTVLTEAQDIIKKYEKMSSKKQKKNYKKYFNQYHIKQYKAHSIKELLLYKKGVYVSELPNGIKETFDKETQKEIEKKLIKTEHHII